MKGADSVDAWLETIGKYASGALKIRSFHGFSMSRGYGTPMESQEDQKQSFRPPRQGPLLNDIDILTADDSKAGQSSIVLYLGLEHRSAGAPPPPPSAAKRVTAGELAAFGLSTEKELEYDVRWVHRRKSKSHSKGKRLQTADEAAMLALRGRAQLS
mmetsp:Transcript_25182/g.44347  ORF Transcript_25182/g.44347 Transcript_25182/m.44347 type:complete len:157 (+) Transcript_25182:1-471(+)